MIGVPVATIRTWEDRYGLVIPDRSAGGHRLYRRDQVEQLKFVRACMADGATAADAHRLLADRDEGGPPVAARADAPDRLVILLAGCDPYAAQFLEHFLRAEGFEVEVALSQQTAQESFSQNAPPLAVVELLSSGGAGSVPVLQGARRCAGGRGVGAGIPGPGTGRRRRRVLAETA